MPETTAPETAQADTAPLWCMHIVGPDDIHAAPDHWTALAWAAELNTAIAAKALKENWASDDNWPLTQAVVVQWQGTASEHAAALAKELAERAAHEVKRKAAAALATPTGAGTETREAGEEAAYQLGKEEGAADGIQRVAERIGIDSEYRWSSNPERSQPGAVELLERIVEHVAALTPATPAPAVDGVEALRAALEPFDKFSNTSFADSELCTIRVYARELRAVGKALATRTPAGAAGDPVGEDEEDWRDDPSADERWNAGLDFGMEQFCAVLGVDPKAVSWDAATETLDGDVCSVIGNILTAWGGDDWQDIMRVREMLLAGQGDDDGMQILPDFEEGASILSMVESCLHLLERRRDVIEASTRPASPAPTPSPESTLEAAQVATGNGGGATTFSTEWDRKEVSRRVGEGDETLARVVSDADMLHACLSPAPSKIIWPASVDATRRAIAALATTPASAGEGELREALRKIAEIRFSDAGEPFDDALAIADAALARPAAPAVDVPAERDRIARIIDPWAWEETEEDYASDANRHNRNVSLEKADAILVKNFISMGKEDVARIIYDKVYYPGVFEANGAVVPPFNESPMRAPHKYARAVHIADAILTTRPTDPDGAREIVRHVKRGTEYEVLVRGAQIQTDTPLTDYAKVDVYRGADGATWVRPVAEMHDGRFVPAASTASSDAGGAE